MKSLNLSLPAEKWFCKRQLLCVKQNIQPRYSSRKWLLQRNCSIYICCQGINILAELVVKFRECRLFLVTSAAIRRCNVTNPEGRSFLMVPVILLHCFFFTTLCCALITAQTSKIPVPSFHNLCFSYRQMFLLPPGCSVNWTKNSLVYVSGGHASALKIRGNSFSSFRSWEVIYGVVLLMIPPLRWCISYFLPYARYWFSSCSSTSNPGRR
jgi:hypothetical protein